MKKRSLFLLFILLFLILSGCSDQITPEEQNNNVNQTFGNNGLGCIEESQEEINQIPVYDPGISRSVYLASKYDVSSEMPPVGNQGSQPSCVGWAVATLKSYQERKSENWTNNHPDHLLSPSWLYNQLCKGKGGGVKLLNGVILTYNKGVDSVAHFPYNTEDFKKQPDQASFDRAARYKGSSYFGCKYIRRSPYNYKKALLEHGPFVGRFNVYENFNISPENPIYKERKGSKLGGHAIVFVGYDDSKRAFKIQNSWGDNWGTWRDENDYSKGKGYFWLSYDLLESLNVYGFIIPDKNNQYDDKAPNVSIIWPNESSILFGITNIQYSVNDNVDIAKVEISIGGLPIQTVKNVYENPKYGIFTQAYYQNAWKKICSTSIDTTSISDGNHIIRVKAYDGTGNSTEATVPVKVVNNNGVINVISSNLNSSISNNNIVNMGTVASAPVSLNSQPYNIFNFTIKNIGGNTLNLTGSPTITISGDPEFTIESMPAASISKQGQSSFSIKFHPTVNNQKRTAVVTIISDDPYSPSLVFTIEAVGVFPSFIAKETTDRHLHYRSGWIRLLKGDFNGDGKMDFVRAHENKQYNRLFISNGDGTFQSYDMEDFELHHRENDSKTYVGDFNGDGKADLLRANYKNTENYILLSTGTGFNRVKTTDYYLHIKTKWIRLLTGDFNGDGKTDFVRAHENKQYNRLFISNGDGTFQSYDIEDLELHHRENYSKTYVGDFNGDGKADLLRANYKNIENYILLSTGTGFNKVKSTSYYLHIETNWIRLLTGDFNGDGKTDFVRAHENSQYNRLFISNGDGTFQSSSMSEVLFHNRTGLVKTYVGDFNGDGKSDLLRTHDNNTLNRLYISLGSEFIMKNSVSYHLHYKTNWIVLLIGDFNGNGLTDFLRAHEKENINWNRMFFSNPLFYK